LHHPLSRGPQDGGKIRDREVAQMGRSRLIGTNYDWHRFLSKLAAATLAAAALVAPLTLLVLLEAHAAQSPGPTGTPNRAATRKPEPFSKRIVQGGLTVDLQVDHQDSRKNDAGEFLEGEDVTVSFKIQDSSTGSDISGLNPAVWMTLVRKSEQKSAKTCTERVQALLGGGLLARAELDLNVYHVLALNADPTITVVDPLFGYGSTKLLALIQLKSAGRDWVITSDQEKLFVSMPASNQVAVINTKSWSVATNIDVGPAPARLALQPDEAYLWISCEANAQSSIAVFGVREMRTVARFPTDRGPHEIAFSDDSRYAFVSNREAGTVSVIDVAKLAKIRDIPLGSKPSSIAFSKLAQAVYVSSVDGTISAISSPKHEVIARIKAAPGLGQIKFAPGDRIGFALNAATDAIYVIDAALNRIVGEAKSQKTPDQLAFSSKLAYVRHRDSEIVLMIPLSEVGKEGKPVPVVDFPGGQNPLGKTSNPSLADAIVPAAEDNAVLVANPADKTIYYYQEGMAAPMGNFSNYGHEPRAVMIVDRSLRERRPGTYLSTARLPHAGQYKVVIFINSPRLLECIDFKIEQDAEQAEVIPPRIEAVTTPPSISPGIETQLKFRITDSVTGKPITGLKDVLALTFAVGVWQDRRFAEHVGEGVYSLTISPPAPGIYNVYLSCASLRLTYRRILTFEAKSER
jgi:YVTN family beta-propeller protein